MERQSQKVLNFQEAIDLHKELHNQGHHVFGGLSLSTHMNKIANLVQNSNIETILDYGCGKAHCWEKQNFHDVLGLPKENICLYDPCVDKYNTFPKLSDLVICIDVMEHIPESAVDKVLYDIFSVTKKAAYFSISYRPAKKILPNGMNAHLTVKPEEWWAEKIRPFVGYKLIKGIKF